MKRGKKKTFSSKTFLRYNPQNTPIKILVNLTSSNIKTSAFERHCEESEKTSHILGEKSCKTYETCIQIKDLDPKSIIICKMVNTGNF